MGRFSLLFRGKTRGSIAEMQQLARERRGKCLSAAYVKSSTKLLWECAEGHRWEALPNNIKRGHWCPHCAGMVRDTIEEMHRIGRELGGKCLSDTYVNSKTKLLWECAEGHRWTAIPSSVKGGRW